jgi:RND family efflux transporter MFP subunit
MNYEARQIGDGERLALPDYEDRPSRRRWVLGVLIVLVLAIVTWFAFGSHKKPADTASVADQVPAVSVMTPGRQSVGHVITATGSLASRREMPVGVAGQGGMITHVLVDPGDWVKAGQVLATVDRSVQTQTAASLAAQVRVAQSDARLAQANLDRAEKLVSGGFISKADIDQLTATRDAAVAKVHVAQAQLAETRAQNAQLDIRAPAAGLVLTRGAEPGQIVSPGSGVLFKIAKDGEMELDAQLNEGDLALLSVGIPAKVTPVGASEVYQGHIWEIEPVIDPQSRQGIAKISVPYHADLRPGGFATATIEAAQRQAPVLPQSAVLSDDKGNYVFVLGKGDTVERRAVTTGAISDQGVAIAEGLTGAEKVVVSAGAFLNPGQKIDPKLVKP